MTSTKVILKVCPLRQRDCFDDSQMLLVVVFATVKLIDVHGDINAPYVTFSSVLKLGRYSITVHMASFMSYPVILIQIP